MTILYLYQYFGTPQGGWSTRVYEMARRWVEAGHHVKVVTSLYDKSDLTAGGLYSRQWIDGIEVIILNVKLSNKQGFFQRLFGFLAFALLSVFFTLKENYDVAIASSGPITIGIPGLVAPYLKRKPLIFEVRDLWPEGAIQLGKLSNPLLQRLAYWFEYRCYQGAQAIVACSQGMADDIRKRFGYKYVHVIPNAADNDLFGTPSNQDSLPAWVENKKVFLYAGTLGLMDNCQQLIEAGKVLQEREQDDVYLAFLGDGQERENLEALANQYLLENVHFLGHKPKAEVVGWMQQATAAFLVFKDVPVLHTSSPNKMFDAFAARTPLIQTTQGWIKALFDQENCGLTVEPGLPTQMADAIQYIATHPNERDQMAENAERLARERFDRDKLAREMLKIIVEVSTNGKGEE